MSAKIAIAPFAGPGMEDAVAAGGGELVEPGAAEGLVWTNPGDPEGLKDALASSPARWVQLPFAGIEAFVAAGAIDPERTWTCAKGIYGHACAEHALAFMLAAARRLHDHASATSWREGGGGFGAPERRLKGATVLIFGAGGIGVELIAMLEPFDAEVIAVNRSGKPVAGASETIPTSKLLENLGRADYVAVTAALTDETRGTFNKNAFDAMAPHAWIVNVARGGLIVTDDLVTALESGAIGGAALDVTDPEPLPEGHPLWHAPNALITPHVANTWDMALPELGSLIERNVRAFARGEALEGSLDPALGY